MELQKKEVEKEDTQEPVKQIREILQSSLSQSPPDSLDTLIHRGEIATQLLSSIPVSRSAALETIASCYLAMLRDKSKEQDGMKRFLSTTSEVIQSLLDHNRAAWSPVIFHWGLGLLVKMSSQHSRRSSTQEHIKYWISSQVARPVLNLTFSCLHHFYLEDPDKCIRLLLEQTKDSNKNCNWICCHLCMSYIDTSIPIVFKLIENNRSNEYLSPLLQSLEYLSTQASDSVKQTILNAFSSVLTDMEGETQREYLSFYLELAAQSTVLWNLVAFDVIKLLTANRLRSLLSQDMQTRKSGDTEQLNRLLHDVVLLLRGEAVYALMECLLHTSYPERSEAQRESQEGAEDGMEEGELREESPQAGRVAERLLEYLMIEMENSARRHVLNRDKRSRHSEKHNTYLFAVDLSLCTDNLLHKYCRQRSDNKLSRALSRILTVIGIFCSDSVAVSILTYCILQAPSDSIITQIPQLQEKLSLMHPQVMTESVKRCLASQVDMSEADKKEINFFKNISTLLNMEAGAVWGSVVAQIHDELRTSVISVCGQLSHSDYTNTYNILYFIEKYQLLPVKARLVKKVNVCMRLITLFLSLLEKSVQSCSEGELNVQCELCLAKARDILGDYCSSDRQCLVFSLRKLVFLCAAEDAPYYHILTGKPQTDTKTVINSNDTSVLERMMDEFSVQNETNSRAGNTRTEGREFAHKIKTPVVSSASSTQTQRAINHAIEQLIALLSQCCLIESRLRVPHITSSYETQSMQQLAQIALDLIAPSEVPGCRDWFDEETLKYNVERHLKIRAKVEDTQFNLQLLLLVANDGVAFITCFPVVRALIYVLVNFWSVSKAEKGTESPSELHLSMSLVRILCRAQWLPAQMLCLMEMFEVLPASDIRQLIEEIQDMLKRSPPDKEEYKLRDNTRVRDTSHADMQQFCELVNVMVIRNVETIGHLVGTLKLSNAGTSEQ